MDLRAEEPNGAATHRRRVLRLQLVLGLLDRWRAVRVDARFGVARTKTHPTGTSIAAGILETIKTKDSLRNIR